MTMATTSRACDSAAACGMLAAALASLSSLPAVAHAGQAGAAYASIAPVEIRGVPSGSSGRAFLFVSTQTCAAGEPRNLVGDDQDTEQLFGKDVVGSDGSPVVMGPADLGYPVANWTDIPAATYCLQVCACARHDGWRAKHDSAGCAHATHPSTRAPTHPPMGVGVGVW